MAKRISVRLFQGKIQCIIREKFKVGEIMKKLPLACLLASLLVLSACQGNAEKEEPPPQAQEKVKTLAKPDFSLASGVHEGTQILEMLVPAGTTVHYTTNGSNPTKESPIYTEPISLEPGKYTYKAIAIDDKKDRESEVHSRSFYIRTPDEAEKRQGNYDLTGSIQGLWATLVDGKPFLFHFQGNSLRTGFLQSEWDDWDAFEVEELSDNGGSLYFPSSNYRVEIDAGKPKDNKIHVKIHSDAGMTDYGDLLYISADTDILNSTEGTDDIRRSLGTL